MQHEPFWGTGIFGCGRDKQQALDSVLCCCCEISRQWNTLVNNRQETLNLPALALSTCGFGCFYYLIRRRVVEAYHLEEPAWLSLFTILCCGQCSLCQTHRELSRRRRWPGSTLKCIYWERFANGMRPEYKAFY